jgi:hypothetical protein
VEGKDLCIGFTEGSSRERKEPLHLIEFITILRPGGCTEPAEVEGVESSWYQSLTLFVYCKWRKQEGEE